MLAKAYHVTLKNMSGKRQASLINCTQQVYEAILFHTKDLGGENKTECGRRKYKSNCLQSGLLMGTGSLNISEATSFI